VRIEQPTLGFIESHAADAARVLDQLPRHEAVALICSVPTRLMVPVARAMSSFAVARCLDIMPEGRAAGLIQRLGIHTTASILRYLSATRREELLAGLPTASAVACRLLLGYPEDTVGSLVDLSVLAMVPATTVAEALQRIGRAADDPGDFLYVVGDDGRLQGQLRVAELLRSSERGQQIGTLMHDTPQPVPAQLSLDAARGQRTWNEHPVLPVTESNDRFLGVLHHHALLKHGSGVLPGDPVSGLHGIGVALGSAYWSLFSSTIRAVVSALPVAEQGKDGAAP